MQRDSIEWREKGVENFLTAILNRFVVKGRDQRSSIFVSSSASQASNCRSETPVVFFRRIDMKHLIARWPGKSPKHEGGVQHPAIYHMLDVAAVAERLMQPFDFTTPHRHALTWLTALHDLGKVGAEFRAMILTGAIQGSGRHWEVTEALLRHHDTARLAPALGLNDRSRWALYAATAGHHGRPPRADLGHVTRMRDRAGAEAIADAGDVIAAFHAFWPQASLADLDRGRITALTWWLPGLVAAADWIGSNTDWFPACAPDIDLADYLDQARGIAEWAVAAAGLATPDRAKAPLFDFTLRPMQSACAQVELRDGPMLALIEDETGAGKTEAALILAQRMMLAGKGQGMFIALPTMATADAMFARARDVVGRMYASGPSLTLAHGRSALSEAYRDVQLGQIGSEPCPPTDPGCAPWLTDSRRRALLADVGVGTIDQALLAVLPTKHACLRLFGLSSKILIVDEVHELGDPYMAVLLCELLKAHAAMGGSAILLTATLPMGLRNRLVAAFEQGAGRSGVVLADPAYPALTVAGGAARTDFARPIGPRGAVAVTRVPSVEAAVDILTGHAANNAACVWVRNAVDEAIAAVEALRARGIPADLLHARYALTDRKRHEAAALARFGKQGTDRAGRVLVATQVVESSLDLDFDVMVSDLAPIAALIQRAGRLWRHMAERPAALRAVPAPVLHIVSPDPAIVTGAQWLQPVLGQGAHVYPLPLQWRTAEVLFHTGKIAAPGDLRRLIEAAHGDELPVPPVLELAEIKADGAANAARNHGERSVVTFADGFRKAAGGWEDTDCLTRLGQPVRVLALARWDGGHLVPWTADGPLTDRWQLSEVQASAARLGRVALPDQTSAAIVAAVANWPDWKRTGVTVCPVGDDGTICEGLQYDAECGLRFTS